MSNDRTGSPFGPLSPRGGQCSWPAQRKMRMSGRRCKCVGGFGDRSQPGRLGEIDLEPVAFALITPCHFSAGVAEVALDMGFLDLRRGGEAGAQRMAPKGALAFALG